MSTPTSPIEVPPVSGTNWTCQIIQDLKLEVRRLRYIRKRIFYWANFLSTLTVLLVLILFLTAVLNIWLQLRMLNVLVAVIAGALFIFGISNIVTTSYDTAFELQDIIDSTVAELRLPVCERIDAIFFTRMIQMDRDNALSDWLFATVYT